MSAALGGCGGEEEEKLPEQCTAGTAEGCAAGLVCEEVRGAEPTCFAPVELRGRVFDLSDDTPVEGATVVALDVNGGARSGVVLTGPDGAYSLPIPLARDAQGLPLEGSVQLSVAAAGFQPFPEPPRQALPIDLTAASATENEEGMTTAYVVQDAATDVGLLALDGDTSGLTSIAGRLDAAEPGGALVLAVQGGQAVSSAVSDLEGEFTLFNVPVGNTSVQAYRAALRVTPEEVDASAGGVLDVVLSSEEGGLSTVSGSVNIVNAPGGSQTSVILALEATFHANTARGLAPMGLRVDPVDGAFAIADVPPGRYVVLAAFENDALVRDPDQSIAGTDIVHIEVPADGSNVVMDESFKVTEALATVAPGADGLEVLPAGSMPSFEWADDSSEDGYELRVYDAFGTLVHENTELPSVTGNSTVRYDWPDASLELGMIYQFRVVSFREKQGGQAGRTYISSTEDLRGVFQIAGATEDEQQ